VLLSSQADLAKQSVLIPTKRGIREFHYEPLGEETIIVGGRRFTTVKWLKQRKDRTDRGFYVWSDKATRIPVRVEKFKKNSTMTMELSNETVNGL
jgi:hypothetical protein